MLIVQGLFNEETKKNLSNSFGSIDRTLRNLEGASGNLDTLIQGESARISSILQDVNSITGNLRNNNEEISNILGNGICDKRFFTTSKFTPDVDELGLYFGYNRFNNE